MLDQHRAVSRHIEDLLDGGADPQADDAVLDELGNSSLNWEWLDDEAVVSAFDTLCRLAGPGTDLWSDIEDTFADLADEYAECLEDDDEHVSVLGETPTARQFADYVFSRAATVPLPGSPGEVGEWIHDGTATYDGVTFTAFTALGISEYLGFAVLTDGDHEWVVQYSPV